MIKKLANLVSCVMFFALSTEIVNFFR